MRHPVPFARHQAAVVVPAPRPGDPTRAPDLPPDPSPPQPGPDTFPQPGPGPGPLPIPDHDPELPRPGEVAPPVQGRRRA